MLSNHPKHFFAVLCLFGFLITTTNIFAQNGDLLSVKNMNKEMNALMYLVEAHPDPYTHIPKKEFIKKFSEIKSTIKEPMSTLEFYKKVASVMALINDGHTSASLPKNWMPIKRKENGAFPYAFYLTDDDDLHIIEDYNEGEIPLKSKVLSINGISVDSFINVIDPYISYEIKSFRNTIIDNDFEKYLYLAFGHSDNTEIEYLSHDTLTTVVKNMPMGDWKKFQKDTEEEHEKKIKRGEPYSYKKVSDDVGMINIFAFYADNLDDYEGFLKKTFKTIEKDSLHSLIIDIRGNYGGWPKIASMLIHYLTNQPFKTMATSRMKISQAHRDHYHRRYPFLKTSSPFLPTQRDQINLGAVLENEIGTYQVDFDYNERPVDKKYEFSGDCYLMTNRDSYSAASSFAATFECYKLGTIIGVETGGTKIFRANSMAERLFKSDIVVRTATTKLRTSCFNQEFEGVQPNVEYSPNIFEIASGADTQLMYTQRVIKSVQKKKAAAASASK